MLPVPYPPPGHFLRHLHIEADTTTPGVAVGRVPVHTDLLGADGTVHIGAIAACLDVTAGALAIAHVHPDWTATTHLSVQTAAGVSAGAAVVRCEVWRAGRTSIFVGARIEDATGSAVGSATIAFQRLARRDGNPTGAGAPEGRVTRMGDGETDSERAPLPAFVGVRRVEAANAVDLDLAPHIANSTGTIQGGVVATVLELAALATLPQPHSGRVADLEVHYLAGGRIGPFRATAFVVRDGAGGRVVRAELRDLGAAGVILATGVATVLT